MISLYKNYESKKDAKNTKESTNNKKLKNFFVLLGKILNHYKIIINKENDRNQKFKKKRNQVCIIYTFKMRKILETISNGKFALYSNGDPLNHFISRNKRFHIIIPSLSKF